MSPQALIRLPHGVRDFLPGEAAALHAVRRTLLERLDEAGYERVMTPAFEYLDVLARGTGQAHDRIFKLVEPSTGQVLALRPDITPQVARLVATALRDRPAPLRLHYFGGVFRLEASHSGVRREVYQVGAECFGVPGPAGDAEVAALLVDGLVALDVAEVTLDLGHVGFLREVLDGSGLEGDARVALEAALARKDTRAVAAALSGARLDESRRALLLALPTLYGDAEVLDRATELLEPGAATAALDDLRAVHALLSDRGLGAHLSVDLGEIRGLGYHSGVVFQAFAPGPGRPLGAGGRYDGLTERFGRSLAATGFALDVAAVLESQGRGR